MSSCIISQNLLFSLFGKAGYQASTYDSKEDAFNLKGLIVPYLLDESVDQDSPLEKERFMVQIQHS